ncbi:hypothetical protein [Sphingobium sp. Sx8-8]|uniref:hypothetical protein n=1 Tax=Sphingobium sp. Sx8-8 TaxID=2933617 RepID=UPI001F55C390|nr:hypothetical protein [Sphingobium sp. Sx8-8]
MVVEVGEVVVHVAGAVLRQAGGLVADLALDYIFSRHTPRLFHGIGRRTIAIATLGRKRIPSSLRVVPRGMKPRPRRNDWLALWVGVGTSIILLAALGYTVACFV